VASCSHLCLVAAGTETAVVNREALTDEVRSTYDAVAEQYASEFPGTEPEQAVDLAMIDHFISRLPGERMGVLDAGCGTGRMSRYLSDRGCLVHGGPLAGHDRDGAT
jgi:2-polyprenyl-3-methyl-5-hydroxy-6-metoxy-1,4-benzoquinol methylase